MLLNIKHSNLTTSQESTTLNNYPHPSFTPSAIMSDYKPTGLSFQPSTFTSPSNTTPEHGGLRQDGQPDKRVGTGGEDTHNFPFTTLTY